MNTQDTLMLTRTDVCRECAISKPTLDRLLKAGAFPKPVYITPHIPRWMRAAVVAWLEAKSAEAAP